MYLDALPKGIPAVIDHVEARSPHDPVGTRLGELGFVPGEAVQIVALGPMGGNPIAVRVGSTRFALRRDEAARICLRPVA